MKSHIAVSYIPSNIAETPPKFTDASLGILTNDGIAIRYPTPGSDADEEAAMAAAASGGAAVVQVLIDEWLFLGAALEAEQRSVEGLRG